jgi:hypothetical protein
MSLRVNIQAVNSNHCNTAESTQSAAFAHCRRACHLASEQTTRRSSHPTVPTWVNDERRLFFVPETHSSLHTPLLPETRRLGRFGFKLG